MISNIIKRLRKPLSLDYINNQLRSKGIATNPRGDNNLSFKLYDMNWDIYCDKGRIGLRNSFNIGNDVDMYCLLQAANQLNNDRWIVKAFIDTYTPDKTDTESNNKESISTIIFSYEGFCYSTYDFLEIYEFAIYAMTDAIEFHRKCYSELLEMKKSQKSASPIGFRSDQKNSNENTPVEDNHKRTKIGFV